MEDVTEVTISLSLSANVLTSSGSSSSSVVEQSDKVKGGAKLLVVFMKDNKERWRVLNFFEDLRRIL